MASSFQSSGDLLADRRYAYAVAAARDGDHEAAADLYEQTLEIVPDWAPAWLALGDARLALANQDGAIAAWQKALAIQPDDRLGAKPRLARFGIIPPLEAVGDAYIRALFDDYADRFDQHLREGLHYSGPETIMAALEHVAPKARFPRILDLGCGTGLMGEAIRPRADWLGGCDLSPAMVARAEAKGVYDWLSACSLLEALHQHKADLILAADVFVYIGDLAPIFAACAASLPHRGLFAFTVQKGEAAISLGDDLRYAHSAQHITDWALASGLTIAHMADCTTRHDRGKPVPGLVCILRQG